MEEEFKQEQTSANFTQENIVSEQQQTYAQPNAEIKPKSPKGLRIANIILLCILLASEAYALYFYIPSIQMLFANDLSSLALLVTLPMFILITVEILGVTIAMTIISACNKKKLKRLQKPILFIDAFTGYIGWLVFALNIIGIIVIYML